jgi:hypothetical protein
MARTVADSYGLAQNEKAAEFAPINLLATHFRNNLVCDETGAGAHLGVGRGPLAQRDARIPIPVSSHNSHFPPNKTAAESPRRPGPPEIADRLRLLSASEMIWWRAVSTAVRPKAAAR